MIALPNLTHGRRSGVFVRGDPGVGMLRSGGPGNRRFLLALLAPVLSYAVQLPVRSYTTADGLPRNVVNRIIRDARGLMWFATDEGLARFDGYNFTAYSIDQGLPSYLVNDILETSTGTFWVAMNRGLCRFNPSAAGPRFTIYHPGESQTSQMVTKLYEDRAHRLWVGTRAGLYWMEETANRGASFHFVDLKSPNKYANDRAIYAILQDRRNTLWVAVSNGLYHLTADGRTELYETRHGLPFNLITQILEDRRAFVGQHAGRSLPARRSAGPKPLDRCTAVLDQRWTSG